jgi:DUF1365 family protein
MNSRIYSCRVMHARYIPFDHKWEFPYFLCAFDLDELKTLDRTVAGFGFNRWCPIRLLDRDYLVGTGDFRQRLAQYVDIAKAHRIMLVTVPRVLVRGFNPVSFYYGLREDGSPAWIVAEVNNTFKERHLYVLEGGSMFPLRCEHAKEFHVSPFNNMEGRYAFNFDALSEHMRISIALIRDGACVMDAAVWGHGRPLTTFALWRTILRQPFTAAMTMPRILWQALILHYRKRLPIYQKPSPSSDMTIIGATK